MKLYNKIRSWVKYDVGSRVRQYQYKRIKHPYIHLMLLPLRKMEGKSHWNHVDETLRQEIFDSYVEGAIQRGFDGIWAEGSAMADINQMISENRVYEILDSHRAFKQRIVEQRKEYIHKLQEAVQAIYQAAAEYFQVGCAHTQIPLVEACDDF